MVNGGMVIGMAIFIVICLILIVILVVLVVHFWDKSYGKDYYDPYQKTLNDVSNRHNNVKENKKKMTPREMYYEGWCDGCDADYQECLKLGYCKGENVTDDEKKTIEELKKEIDNAKKK